MANPYYSDNLSPESNSRGLSSKIRDQFSALEDAFDALEHVVMLQIDLDAATSHWIPVPWACTVASFCSSINGALTDSDAVLTLEIGGVLVTGSTLTITQSGSAAGDYDSATITGANTLAADSVLELICDGGPTAAVTAQVMITFKRTA